MSQAIEPLTLRFELLSAATFGRGDGLPGSVDREVEHDGDGLPLLRARTLRGLLAEEMEGLLYALGVKKTQPWGTMPDAEQRPPWQKRWVDARNQLLGASGRTNDETGVMRVGDARLPAGVRKLVAATLQNQTDGQINRTLILEAMTGIRRQTAMTHLGAPDEGTLRSLRVVLREVRFEAPLRFDRPLEDLERALLAATVLAWRRAGTGRNRGRGRLRAWLEDEEPGGAWMQAQFKAFQEALPK